MRHQGQSTAGVRYHRRLLDDYIAFVSGLVEVERLCQVSEDDAFDFHDKRVDQVYQDLEVVRLHDFYLKRNMKLWCCLFMTG